MWLVPSVLHILDSYIITTQGTMVLCIVPAGDVDARRYDVRALPAPGEMPGQGQLEEVERHVDMVGPQPQLLGQRRDLLLGVFQRDLPRLAA